MLNFTKPPIVDTYLRRQHWRRMACIDLNRWLDHASLSWQCWWGHTAGKDDAIVLLVWLLGATLEIERADWSTTQISEMRPAEYGVLQAVTRSDTFMDDQESPNSGRSGVWTCVYVCIHHTRVSVLFYAWFVVSDCGRPWHCCFYGPKHHEDLPDTEKVPGVLATTRSKGWITVWVLCSLRIFTDVQIDLPGSLYLVPPLFRPMCSKTTRSLFQLGVGILSSSSKVQSEPNSSRCRADLDFWGWAIKLRRLSVSRNVRGGDCYLLARSREEYIDRKQSQLKHVS